MQWLLNVLVCFGNTCVVICQGGTIAPENNSHEGFSCSWQRWRLAATSGMMMTLECAAAELLPEDLHAERGRTTNAADIDPSTMQPECAVMVTSTWGSATKKTTFAVGNMPMTMAPTCAAIESSILALQLGHQRLTCAARRFPMILSSKDASVAMLLICNLSRVNKGLSYSNSLFWCLFRVYNRKSLLE